MRFQFCHGQQILGEIEGFGFEVFEAVSRWVREAEAREGCELRFAPPRIPYVLRISSPTGSGSGVGVTLNFQCRTVERW